jgi:hypothetical protein
MTAYSGYVKGVNLLSSSRGVGARKVYEIGVDTTAVVSSSDTIVITGVPDRIDENVKSGKSFNYISSLGCHPVIDASGIATYPSLTISNSSGTLTIQLCEADPTCAATAASAVEGLNLIVVGYES